MVAIKTNTDIARITGTVANQAQTKMLKESSAIIVIGNLASTGAPFQRAFPTIAQANQWLTTGAAADVEVTRVESITFTQ